jgi:NADH:ubiquinone oxidoreductase subunit 4 (subunit M)
VEKYLITLATVSMVIFYYSEYSLNLYFCFESAGIPLLVSIMLFGRQPQKVEASKTILIYIAFPSLPLLLKIARGSVTSNIIFQTISA